MAITAEAVGQAGIVSLIIMFLTLGVALVARAFGLQLGVRQDVRAQEQRAAQALAAGARSRAGG